MPIELTMPRLSDTMEAGTIIKWNVKEGDKVVSGTAVADVETDKATMEMQSFDDGTLAKILVPEGRMVPIGTVIALIAEPGEDAKAVAATSVAATSVTAKPVTAKSVGTEPVAATSIGAKASAASPSVGAPGGPSGGADHDGDGARMRVSPVARRIADEHGIDLSRLHGSGPGGRVVKDDVLAAVARGPAAAQADGEPRGATAPRGALAAPRGGLVGPRGATVAPPAVVQGPSSGAASGMTPLDGSPAAASSVAVPATAPGPLVSRTIALSGIRHTIAKRLVESKTTIPHYQVTMRIDMEPLLSLRATLNAQLESQGVKLSVNDFLIRACAIAMHQHHEFNASWAGADGVTVHGNVNIGVAIALPRERGGGLVVGVIRDADRKGLRQISQEARALGEKARGRGLGPEEMSDSTFTISNLGMFGVDHFTAIINPPNSAILAVGAAIEQPVVRNGQVVVGHEMSATLSLDHRVIDGAMAAAYLQTLKSLMENPAALLV
ncbi:MAG: dihydrolipoamide acetyltransferase family protein [Phycisphaerales bacterium]